MENKREKVYDFLRTIAIICVIISHCMTVTIKTNDFSALWWQKNIIEAIVRCGIIIFVFISGALLLNKPDEKISTFYYKRFVKIVIPFFIYSFFYVWIDKYKLNINIFLPKNFLNVFLSILEKPVSTHLWFMYMIIGLYLFTPYIKKISKNLNEKETINLFILLFVISIIEYLLPSFNIKIGINSLLIIGWIIPFILGYLLTKEVINKHYKLLYILGFLSFIFLIIAKRYLPNMESLYDLAPTMLLQNSAIFVFFIKNKEKICESKIINKITYFISKYTYDIYLVHIEIINILLYISKGWFNYGAMVNTAILAIATFVFSLIIGAIINNIIKMIEKIIRKTINITKNRIVNIKRQIIKN